MTRRPTVTITFDRTIVEHPRALHIKRMKSAIWLYLALIARRASGDTVAEVELGAIAQSMGLSESTVRTWLGHLKKRRYIDVLARRNGTVRLRLKHRQPDPEAIAKPRRLTVEGLERSLGESGYRERLATALSTHSPPAILYALDRATEVPRSKIRRSRTALFLYLLNHDDTQQENHPRH